MLAIAMLCAACDQDKAVKVATEPSIKVCTVDVEKVMTSSDAAKARDEHMKKVLQVLQSGMNDLGEKLKKQPEKQVQAQLGEAQRLLQVQLNRERLAANQVVHGLMVNAVKAWRVSNNQKNGIVVAKQTLLDSDVIFDITDQIIVAMNAGNKPTFPELPTVKITQENPKEAKKPSTEAKKPSTDSNDNKNSSSGKKGK